MSLVIDDVMAGSKTATGLLLFVLTGLHFEPIAINTVDPVTDFSSKQPEASELEPCSVAGQDPCTSGSLNTVTSFNQDSPDHFGFDYNLGNGSSAGRFAGSLIDFGNSTWNSTTAIVFGMRATGTTKALMDAIDINGKKVTVQIPNITFNYQNYKITKALLDSAGIPGFDATRIQFFAIVINDTVTGSPTSFGTMEINTRGFSFGPPSVDINSFIYTANGGQVTLSGRVSNFDAAQHKLTVDLGTGVVDITSMVLANGTFSHVMTLNPGTYSASLKVLDRTTSQILQQAIIPNIIIAPSVVIGSFVHSVNSNQVTLSGNVSNFDAAIHKLTLDLGTGVIDITSQVLANGTFSYTLALNPGTYTASLKVLDRTTSQVLQQATISNIVIVPSVAIGSFTHVINGSQVTLSGNVSNFNTAQHILTLDLGTGVIDITSQVLANGTFSYTMALNPGTYTASLKILDRTTSQVLQQAAIPNIVIVHPTNAVVLSLYGGALPPGATIISTVELTPGRWNVKVQLNNSTSASVVRYQTITIVTTSANAVRIYRVTDQNYQSQNLMRSDFIYANNTTATSWQTIDRYTASGAKISTLRIVTQSGKTYYKLDYLNVSKTDVLLGEIATMTWAQVLAQAYSLQG